MNLDPLRTLLDGTKEKTIRLKRKLLHQEDPDPLYDTYGEYETPEDDPPDYEAAGIDMAEGDEDMSRQGKQLNKKHIGMAVAAVVFIGASAVAYTSLSPKSSQPGKKGTSLSQNVAGNTLDGQNLPSNYSDIAKYQTKDQRGGVVKTQPNQSVRTSQTVPATARPSGSAATVSRTAGNASTRTTASYDVPQARVSIRKETPADTTRSAAQKAETDAMNSAIAFSIAQAVTQQAMDGTQANGSPSVSLSEAPDAYYGYEAPADATYALQAGSVIQATLLTGITSDSPNSDVVAQVRQNIYDSNTGQHILIPQGSRLIGTYGNAGNRGNARIGVTFTRIILPNGDSLTLPDPYAVDGAGIPGLADQYTQHSGSLFRTGIMTGLIAAAAQSATGNTSGTDTRSPGQEAVSGAVSQILDTADRLLDRDANISPTITIRPGLEFSVFINEDLWIHAYDE